MMVRDFQSIIGKEAKKQILKAEGKLPTHVIACIGGAVIAIDDTATAASIKAAFGGAFHF